jgi:type II secretory pathway pseudopilin PulG
MADSAQHALGTVGDPVPPASGEATVSAPAGATQPGRGRAPIALAVIVVVVIAVVVAVVAATKSSSASGGGTLNGKELAVARAVAHDEAEQLTAGGPAGAGWPTAVESASVIKVSRSGAAAYVGSPPNVTLPSQVLVIRLIGHLATATGGAGCPPGKACPSSTVTAATVITGTASTTVLKTTVTTQSPAPELPHATFLYRR